MSVDRVTIAIACQDEEHRIEAVVRGALGQDWPADRLEVVVADGMSMDATREVLARLASGDDRLRLVDDPGRSRATGLNACIRHASGAVVVCMDPAGEYTPGFVRECVAALERTDADCVGGAARPAGRSFVQRCVAAALRSPIGAGGWGRSESSDRGWAGAVAPGAFRRALFERVGLFDPHAATDEDAELGKRVEASGGRVAHADELVAVYCPQGSLRALARRSFASGRGRARTTLKHGRFASWGPALPLLWLAGEVAIAAASPRRALPWSLAAYGLATGVEALRVGVREGPLAVPVVWALFPLLQVAHGAGFVAGLAQYVREPDWDVAERLPVEAPGLGGEIG